MQRKTPMVVQSLFMLDERRPAWDHTSGLLLPECGCGFPLRKHFYQYDSWISRCEWSILMRIFLFLPCGWENSLETALVSVKFRNCNQEEIWHSRYTHTGLGLGPTPCLLPPPEALGRLHSHLLFICLFVRHWVWCPQVPNLYYKKTWTKHNLNGK